MSLICRKLPNESWRGCVERYATKYGLQSDALLAFDVEIAAGTEESRACWNALYEWDLLEFEDGA